jgi:beta-lactamase regulating signal transducer with metallopeptidase domain/protein involved in polysaccharide export with SLBB domain
MNSSSPPAIALLPCIAQTLAHFLWQGAALWGATLAVLYITKGACPRVRYAILLVQLLLMAACPLLTLASLYQQHDSATAVTQSRPTIGIAGPGELRAIIAAVESSPPAAVTPQASTLIERVIVCGWLVGVLLFSTRLGFGVVGVYRLVYRSKPVPAAVERVVEQLARRMAYRVRPSVRSVERISQAMAVGVFRPMILVPTAWLLELQPEVLEAVLAHELAHLRRWDLPINLLQRFVEAALFFHPAVWWCSRRLRIERELCCDSLAVRSVGDRAQYAKALTYLATRPLSSSESLLGATFGGSKMILRERIRNVLGNATPVRAWMYGPSCAAVGAFAASLVWIAFGGGKAESRAVDVPPKAPAIATQTPVAQIPPENLHKYVAVAMPDVNAAVVVDAPNASHMAPLPPYVIEAPDVLAINVATESEDAKAGKSAAPIQGEFLVWPDGAVDLPGYGRVQVSGLTISKAQDAIGQHIQQCAVRAEVEEKMKERTHAPDISLNVATCNSKNYYIVTESRARGDQLQRIPITGNETVLDALSYVEGFDAASGKVVWVARPAPAGSGLEGRILPVDLQAIVEKHDQHSNWQLFPGDRIFITDPSSFDPNSAEFATAVANTVASATMELVANSLDNVASFLRAGAQIDWREGWTNGDENAVTPEPGEEPDAEKAVPARETDY